MRLPLIGHFSILHAGQIFNLTQEQCSRCSGGSARIISDLEQVSDAAVMKHSGKDGSNSWSMPASCSSRLSWLQHEHVAHVSTV